jgi:hypothetical protein
MPPSSALRVSSAISPEGEPLLCAKTTDLAEREAAMAQTKRRKGDNPAQIKGDIARGLTGDKRPGFDPAMSSLETDSEAGGTALTSEQVTIARETQLSPAADHKESLENGAYYHDAMQRIEGSPSEPSAKGPLLVMGAVGVAVLVAACSAFLLI